MDVKIKNSSPKIFIFGFFSVYLQCWNEATQPTTTSLTTKQKINEEESHRAGLNIKKTFEWCRRKAQAKVFFDADKVFANVMED